MTPVEFFEAVRMKRENEKALIDLQYQTPWEVARVLLLHLYNMNPNIKKPPKTVGKVFQVPWDKNKGKEEGQSLEEMAAALQSIHGTSKKKINIKKVKLRKEQREKEKQEEGALHKI